MSDRSEILLTELLEVQRRILTNQEAALQAQQVAQQRYWRLVRNGLALIAIAMAAILLPYAWQWGLYFAAR